MLQKSIDGHSTRDMAMEHGVAEVDHPVVVVIHRMVHRIVCNTPTDNNNTGLSVTPKDFIFIFNK